MKPVQFGSGGEKSDLLTATMKNSGPGVPKSRAMHLTS